MKKIIVAILSFLYLGTSTGATIHFHYCMEKIVEWGFWANKSDQCGNCGMSKSQEADTKGCCKDEQKVVKLKNDQKALDRYQILLGVTITLAISTFETPTVPVFSAVQLTPSYHAPPKDGLPAIYIRNCVFRI